MAWGRGNPDWGTSKQSLFTFPAGDVIATGYVHISAVVVTSPDGANPYAAGTDYTVDTIAGTITRVTAGTIPAEAQVRVDLTVDRPPEDVEQTALLDEVGRRSAALVQFCSPDPAGEIVVPNGRFTASVTPTNNLHVQFNFDFEDAATETIRELAVYTGTVTDPDLPVGQLYVTPADVVDPGILLLENISPVPRAASTRETFPFVITL